MSYTRVIPRDFFNEAKLLKCFGQLALKQLDGLLPEGIDIEIDENGGAFDIQLDDAGYLYIANYRTTLNGQEVLFYSSYNSKGAYPFHVIIGEDEYEVFNEDGSFANEFKALGRKKSEPITFTQIKNDVNGSPRYVCHWVNFKTDTYSEAVKLANTIGGRKFNTKTYGGGIVFQSYNILDTERQILALIK
jgi:hypothetical protein